MPADFYHPLLEDLPDPPVGLLERQRTAGFQLPFISSPAPEEHGRAVLMLQVWLDAGA